MAIFIPQKKLVIQNYSEQKNQTDGKVRIVRAGEIVQWVRSLLCILEDFSLKPSIHTKSQAWLAVHACNPNIVGGEGRRIAGAIRKPAHLGVY